MKRKYRQIIHLIQQGYDFFSIRHSGCDYFTLLPCGNGYFKLLKNHEYQPSIIVCCYNDRIKAIGLGDRSGYADTIHLDDVDFLDFDGESNFIEENYGFTASYNGEEVFLFTGEEPSPDRFQVESNLI